MRVAGCLFVSVRAEGGESIASFCFLVQGTKLAASIFRAACQRLSPLPVPFRPFLSRVTSVRLRSPLPPPPPPPLHPHDFFFSLTYLGALLCLVWCSVNLSPREAAPLQSVSLSTVLLLAQPPFLLTINGRSRRSFYRPFTPPTTGRCLSRRLLLALRRRFGLVFRFWRSRCHTLVSPVRVSLSSCLFLCERVCVSLMYLLHCVGIPPAEGKKMSLSPTPFLTRGNRVYPLRAAQPTGNPPMVARRKRLEFEVLCGKGLAFFRRDLLVVARRKHLEF